MRVGKFDVPTTVSVLSIGIHLIRNSKMTDAWRFVVVHDKRTFTI